MPVPLVLAAAGAQLAGNAINSAGQQRQNVNSEMFTREMYERQKQDNIAFWNMQNDYNSPASQMRRFKSAGLNPNLIYGQGSGAGNAQSISTPDVQPVQRRNPEWGNAISAAGLAGINAHYDLQIKQATIDNLKAQNTVIQQEALLKSAQTTATTVGGEKTAFGLDLDKELRGVSADARREQLRQLTTTTDLAMKRDAREAAMNSTSIQEATQRMLTSRLQNANTKLEAERIKRTIKLLDQDGTLKELDIALRKKGISPTDPLWTRITGQFLTSIFDNDGTVKADFGSLWKWLTGE